MQKTKIEWSQYTSNPIQYRDKAGNVVWGCVHTSPGCFKCYSEALAKRYGRGGKFDVKTMADLTPFVNQKEIHSILTYKPASGKMCFLGDMTDIFGEWVPFELIDQVFAAMALRPDVTFQILTKRSDRMREYLSHEDVAQRIGELVMLHEFTNDFDSDYEFDARDASLDYWPLPNVWLGVSAENQQYADERIPKLLETPAAKRFISYEPALGPLSLQAIVAMDGDGPASDLSWIGSDARIDWVICGGESGPGARPMQPEWARSVRDQCVVAGVPLFFKQWGGVQKSKAGRELDGRTWDQFPK